jgi:peptide/nickel transport system permease protein
MKNYKKTLIGLLILSILLAISLLYPYYGSKDYREKPIYDEHKNFVGMPPHKPSLEYPLGTDRNGRDNLLLIVDGLKYTLAAIVMVALLTVLVGTIFGIIISVWMPPLISTVKAFLFPFRYVPTLLIAVILMQPAGITYNVIPVGIKIEYQLIILFMLGLPAVFIYTTDLIEEISKRPFVIASKLMGGNKIHVMARHIMPNLKPYLLIIFIQQIQQTLQIMMGLSMFSIFFGGADKKLILNTEQTMSITNELTGLTGQNFWWLKYAPYIALSSLTLLLTIFLLINMIKKEVVANLEGKYVG